MIVKKQLLTLKAYIPGKSIEEVKKEFGLTKIVKLASNENPFGCSPKVQEALTTVTSEYAIYPDGAAVVLRERVAKHLGVAENQLIFASGLDELIQIISRALLSPETNVVMAASTFPQYRHHAVIENAEIREVPLKNGCHDLVTMLECINEQTRIVWICNPNNPTGTYVNVDVLHRFLERVPKDTLVVMDEAYYEYATAQDYPQTIPLLQKYENIMILRTFSKAYGLAAFRIGYGIAHACFIQQLEVSRLPFNTSTLAQMAALAAMGDQEFVKTCVKENAKGLEQYYQFCKKYRLSYYPSQGNFIFIEVEGITGAELFQCLLEKGYIVRPFPTGIRITVGTSQENEELLKLLEEILKRSTVSLIK